MVYFRLNLLRRDDLKKRFVFQDYFKTNQIPRTSDYVKMFHRKYWGSLKMSNEDH